MAYTICIINANTLNMNDYMDEQLFSSLHEHIKKIITFKEISSNEELIKTTVETLDLPTDIFGNTTRIYQTKNHIYEMLHLIHDKSFQRNDNENGVATWLMKDHEIIRGNILIVKTKMLKDKTCIPSKMTFKDLLKILHSKAIHRGIFVNNNEITEYSYKISPIETITGTERTNLRSIEINYLDMLLIIFVELKPSNDNVNEYATMIMKNEIVYGRVFFSLASITRLERFDLTKKLFKQIIAIMSDSTFTTQITTEEDVQDRLLNEKRMTTNIYRIISDRYNKFINEHGMIAYIKYDLSERKNIHEVMQK